eukprot:Em0014g630a
MQKLFILLALLASGNCNSFNAISYGFPLNSLLECYVANPLASYTGQPKAILEIPPKINLVPGPDGTVWLPQNSEYKPLVAENLNVPSLVNFLGEDYLPQLSQIIAPSTNTPAPFASQYIGVADGSGESIILLSSALTNGYPSNWDTTLTNFVSVTNPVETTAAKDLINAAGIGYCPLRTNWTRLPSSYFPPYVSGGYCSDSPLLKTCSVPAGLHCRPDLSPNNLVYMTVLRWDCCFSFQLGQSRWDCGWRKVQIPLVARCNCGCN